MIADASEKDEQLVASLGADIVVRRGDDVASRFASTSRGAWMASPTGRCSTSASSWTCAMPAPSPPSRASRAIRSATSAPRPPSCAPMRRRGRSSTPPRPGRGGAAHAQGGRNIPAGKGGRRPPPAGGWRDQRTVDHRVVMGREEPQGLGPHSCTCHCVLARAKSGPRAGSASWRFLRAIRSERDLAPAAQSGGKGRSAREVLRLPGRVS